MQKRTRHLPHGTSQRNPHSKSPRLSHFTSVCSRHSLAQEAKSSGTASDRNKKKKEKSATFSSTLAGRLGWKVQRSRHLSICTSEPTPTTKHGVLPRVPTRHHNRPPRHFRCTGHRTVRAETEGVLAGLPKTSKVPPNAPHLPSEAKLSFTVRPLELSGRPQPREAEGGKVPTEIGGMCAQGERKFVMGPARQHGEREKPLGYQKHIQSKNPSYVSPSVVP